MKFSFQKQNADKRLSVDEMEELQEQKSFLALGQGETYGTIVKTFVAPIVKTMVMSTARFVWLKPTLFQEGENLATGDVSEAWFVEFDRCDSLSR